MSGGSWDYMYLMELHEIIERYGGAELEERLNALSEVSWRAGEHFTQILNAYYALETEYKKLTPLLKAIEWFDSNDIGRPQLEEALKEYESGHQ